MNDRLDSNAVLTDDFNGSWPGEPRSIVDHARHIQQDVASLADELRVTTVDIERYLVDGLTQRPYTTLGAAAGIGYVLGGGLRSKLTAILFGAAARLVTALAARELSARMAQHDPSSVRNKST